MNSVEEINRMAVIGSGVMGHGIAEVYALNGYPTTMMDVNNELLERGMRQIRAELRTLVNNEFVTENESEEALNRISSVTNIKDATEGCDFVTEAVTEDLKMKREVFTQLERYASDNSILATNTSGLMITKIAQGLKRPDRVIGTHFSVPPHIVPGVEIIRGRKTSDRTFRISYDLMKKIGKVPFVVKKEIDGFLLNRLQLALGREAFYLVEKGVATMEDVDICLNSVLGLRWATVGPFRQMDSAGIDTACKVWKYILRSISNSRRTPKAMTEKVAKGELGMKTRKGFYDYVEFKPEDVTIERDIGFLKTLKLMKTIWK
jgi:3-hydroxybutyryl-CoA dehydrogenase